MRVKKVYITLTPVANVIKLFTAVSYTFSKQARAFVPGIRKGWKSLRGTNAQTNNDVMQMWE